MLAIPHCSFLPSAVALVATVCRLRVNVCWPTALLHEVRMKSRMTIGTLNPRNRLQFRAYRNSPQTSMDHSVPKSRSVPGEECDISLSCYATRRPWPIVRDRLLASQETVSGLLSARHILCRSEGSDVKAKLISVRISSKRSKFGYTISMVVPARRSCQRQRIGCQCLTIRIARNINAA